MSRRFQYFHNVTMLALLMATAEASAASEPREAPMPDEDLPSAATESAAADAPIVPARGGEGERRAVRAVAKRERRAAMRRAIEFCKGQP